MKEENFYNRIDARLFRNFYMLCVKKCVLSLVFLYNFSCLGAKQANLYEKYNLTFVNTITTFPKEEQFLRYIISSQDTLSNFAFNIKNFPKPPSEKEINDLMDMMTIAEREAFKRNGSSGKKNYAMQIQTEISDFLLEALDKGLFSTFKAKYEAQLNEHKRWCNFLETEIVLNFLNANPSLYESIECKKFQEMYLNVPKKACGLEDCTVDYWKHHIDRRVLSEENFKLIQGEYNKKVENHYTVRETALKMLTEYPNNPFEYFEKTPEENQIKINLFNV